ncbi:MAG: hypothetical protein WBC70_12595 [Candidatus Aminicenantales bacterium]
MSQHIIWKSAAAGLLTLAFSLAGFAGTSGAGSTEGPVLQEHPAMEFPELPSSGKKCRIDDAYYFIYEFTEKPRLGTAILRIRISDGDENRSTDFTVLGRSDMPSMAGSHDSGDQEFKLNNKGDYLLPVNIVMPGEWEVKLTFKRGDTIISRGAFRFDV